MARTKDQMFTAITKIIPEPYWGDSSLVWSLARTFYTTEAAVLATRDLGFWGNAGDGWLDLHALGWGLHRTASETDAALLIRLRTYPAQVVPQSIIDVATDLVQAFAPSEGIYFMEHWKDGAFLDDTCYCDQGIEYTHSRIGDWADGFSVILSTDIYSDPFDVRYEAIVYAIEAIRPHGARSHLVVDNA